MDLNQFLTNTINQRVFLAPNTSDEDLVQKAKQKLSEAGIAENLIQINYNVQELEPGDLFISYDPPDLVVRIVYGKKPNGLVKLKSAAMIRL